MKFLTSVECSKWCDLHRYQLLSDEFPVQVDFEDYLVGRFPIPIDAGRRVAISKMLFNFFLAKEPEFLLWITDWSVWPSGEHMPLAMDVRRAHGDSRTIKEAPGHIFRIGDENTSLTFMAITILFLWDAYILPSNNSSFVHLSHDEYVTVFNRGPQQRQDIQRIVETYELDYEELQ